MNDGSGSPAADHRFAKLPFRTRNLIFGLSEANP
jgi:hypothetical protein